jgi:hypothetical protein
MNTSPANTNARDEIDPWFVLAVAVAAVAVNYLLGPTTVLALCASWLWCARAGGADA